MIISMLINRTMLIIIIKEKTANSSIWVVEQISTMAENKLVIRISSSGKTSTMMGEINISSMKARTKEVLISQEIVKVVINNYKIKIYNGLDMRKKGSRRKIWVDGLFKYSGSRTGSFTLRGSSI